MKSLQDEICQALEQLCCGMVAANLRRTLGKRSRRRRTFPRQREGNIFEQGVHFSRQGESLSALIQHPEAAGHDFYAMGTSMVLCTPQSLLAWLGSIELPLF